MPPLSPSVIETIAPYWCEGNAPVSVSDLSTASTRVMKFRCPDHDGHEWSEKFFLMVRRVNDTHCPYCNGRKILKGFNDLITTHPELASQLEGPSQGTLLMPGSAQIVTWRCVVDPDHLYRTTTGKRLRGDGCTLCSGKVLVADRNSFAAVSPELVCLWDTDENGGLLPTEVKSQSNVQYWWKCKLGHGWSAPPSSLTGGHGCPYCAGKKVLPGFNDMATTHPRVASQMSASLNDGNGPESLTSGSKKSVWWECDLGHSLQEHPHNRTHKGYGCPYCSSRRLLTGFNDLATVAPHLVTDWHPTKNAVLPDQVHAGPAWWLCNKCGWEWTSPIIERKDGIGCLACASRSKTFVSQGETELADFIEGLGFEVKRNVRGLLGKRHEVDAYLPELDIAFEFNGTYWHSEAYAGLWYHHNKHTLASRVGVDLVQVWSDDWASNRGVLEREITSRLFSVQENDAIGSSCTAIGVSVSDANAFLDDHHLDGTTSGRHYIGLILEGSLVAVSVLKEQRDGHLMSRYASSRNIIGGRAMIASHAITHCSAESVFVLDDLSFSNADELLTSGFEVVADVAPDCSYIRRGGIREPRSDYRLSRFKEDPDLIFKPGLAERDLAIMNGLSRVYDAGRVKYVLRGR